MKRNWAYLKYLLRHKWFVLLACRKYKCSIWRGIVHDLSKFLPSEWTAYAHCFYNDDGSKRYVEDTAFKFAWLKHQRRNPHHHQYWVLSNDDGSREALRIPEKYMREMLADWEGAGRAIRGKTANTHSWYIANRDRICMHRDTREWIEYVLWRAYEDVHE